MPNENQKLHRWIQLARCLMATHISNFQFLSFFSVSTNHGFFHPNSALLLPSNFPGTFPTWLLSRSKPDSVLFFLFQLLANPSTPKLGGVAPERLQIKNVAK
jgi:hypothetical protein